MRISMNEKYISVTQLTRYIKYKIDQDEHLNTVFLKGEISNFKAHTRGHFYFTLKDENSRINAIMFSSSASKIKFKPEDGMKVLVTGKVSVYEATGNYQIYVNEMIEDGVGNLYVAFEQLKKKLEAEGLFQPTFKKPIPKIPRRIGIVTASTGAAIRDIVSTISRRWPLAETILFPCLVQGAEAKESIVRQIERANQYDLDVLIVGRGGGSIEDLWPFNEEIVARAIFASTIPIISAVGHEVDFTIADFVADLRAPTPTGAAEMAVPNKSDVLNYLMQLKIRAQKSYMAMLESKKERLQHLTSRYIFQNPISMYQAKEQQLDQALELLRHSMQTLVLRKQERMNRSFALLPLRMETVLERCQHRYQKLVSKLEVLNPLLTLKRGYTIVKKEDIAIDSSQKLKKEDSISIEFRDGIVDAIVKGIK